MRNIDVDQAQNYIKKHKRHKRWIAFALCLSLLTGTVTLYGLNKPATAMTEEGAKSIGLVLETADSEFESDLIEQTLENKEESADSVSSGSDADVSKEEAEENVKAETADVVSEDGADSASTGSDADESKVEADQKEEKAADASSADSSDEGKEAASSEGSSKKAAASDASSSASSEKKTAAAVASSSASTEEDEEAADASSSASSKVSSVKASVEVKEDVVITVLYEDAQGEEIEESKELKISESFDISEDVREFEGYVFDKAIVGETEVTKIVKKTGEYTYYEAELSDGNILEIDEDVELRLIYKKLNTKDEFEFRNDEYSVKVKLSDPSALPDGVELKVTTINKDTKGYNYDAYIDALNENAQNIADEKEQNDAQTYNEANTLILDIAFLLDGVEYQPGEGNVSVSLELVGNQLSETLGATDDSSVGVIHLPVDETIMESLDATSDATDIAASDINVEVIKDSTVDLSGDSDSVSFETDSFSAYAFIYLDNVPVSWTGDTQMSAADIIDGLGKAKYFGAVADSITGGSHFEANVAVNNYSESAGGVLFDYDYGSVGYINSDEYKNYKVTVEKKSTSPGTFYFGVYEDEKGKNKISSFSFSPSDFSFNEGMYVATKTISVNDVPSLYVYELTGNNGSPVKSGEEVGHFTVTYSSNINESNNALDALMSSYITNGDYSSSASQMLHENSSLYYNASLDGWTKASKDSSGNVHISPEKYSIPVNFVDSMLDSAKELSAKLPYVASSDSVEVFNVVHSQWSEYMDDFVRAANAANKSYGWSHRDDVKTKTSGIQIGDNSILVINIDLTGCNDYTIGEIVVNGVKSNEAYNSYNSIASRVIINPVQRNSAGVYEPYTGTLRIGYSMGTVLAPSANVEEGGILGAVIGNTINFGGEIHKSTLIGFKEASGTVTITNTGKDQPKGKIVKVWNGRQAYSYIYAYVCARAYLNGKGILNIPEYSSLITLSDENNWTQEVTFPSDTYTKDGVTYDVVYRVVEVNAFKNGTDASGGIYSYEELQERLQNGNEKNEAGSSLFLYNDETGKSSTVNGYFTSYSSSISTETKLNGSERIIYTPGNTDKDRTVTITNNEEVKYELYAYKVVDGIIPQSNEKFSFTLRFWNGSSWDTLADDLQNGSMRTGSGDTPIESYRIGYTVEPSKLGMEVGDSNDYYFLFTENTENLEGYTAEPAKILVKIKYYTKYTPQYPIIYYLYDENDPHYTSVETNPSGNNNATRNGTDILDLSTLPVFKNHALTQVEVIKQWGENGTHNGKDFTFDIDVVLKRKHVGEEDSAYVEVDRKTIAKGSTSALFNNLPVYDKDTNTKYEYAVDEYYGDTQFILNGKSVNGFKLTNYTVSEDGKVITLVNQPVIIIEKVWTKNGVPISYEDTKDFGEVFVNVYQRYSEDKPIAKAVELSYDNKWKQELVLPRIFINKNAHSQQYYYYIVECNSKGEEVGTGYITTYSATGGNSGVSDGKTAIVYADNENTYNITELKLIVTNERGDNVLPSTGGTGTAPLIALGILLMSIAFAGFMTFRKRDSL